MKSATFRAFKQPAGDGNQSIPRLPRLAFHWGSLLLVAAVCLKFSFAAETEKTEVPKSPLSPEKSLQQTVVHPDFEMQVVAAEPNVVNPVAVAFDESGVLWAVEMTDYPHGPKPGEVPKSRIKLLRD